eukprot:TRINITY_DN7068_c0_g2_i3.p1 TRINITY_DN7068_c0_g2~~TRINITY_DN7068_c0_g2_i3.p1  ORF type:complete len:1669 (+),score=441.76 TRINITY_DN7068_c0_g2_i3:89-5095(+)
MSERYPGELVWLPDAEVVWRAGEIVKVEGSTIWVSKDSSAEPSIVDGQKLLARGKDEYTGGGLEVLEDLTQLPHLHEASVLNSLQHAFELDQIYTFTGPILIAINPFRSISGLYGPEVMQDFLVKSGGSSGSSGKPKPHVFAVANAACQGMRTKRTSQTVLISGESGAGKTESTKYVMRLVTASGGAPRQESDDDKGSVEGRILASNPILEAFGNAKTLRNDNSSRFGKFIALQFEDKDAGELVSSKVETYLLEKVRVVDQQEGERNYHIFYQACAASASDRRTGDVLKSLSLKGLQSHSAFRYLTKSSCSVLKAGIDDAVEFEHTATALRSIGLDDTTLDVFVGVIAAILNAGNLDFEDAGAGSDGSKVPDRCKDTLTLVGELLGVEATTLESAMCNRTIRDPRGETMTSPVKPAQAFDARDALARQLYGSLFDYIVKQINKSIGLGDSNGKEVAMLFVGVLDIFGFECFKLNSFEQLCINLTNERLQQYFNTFVFKLEQELYSREGIPWDALDFPDNQDCLDLLQGRPQGILALLDEECKMPRGTDKGFCSKLWKAFDKHARFDIIKTKPDSFVVKHFAGPVEYLSDHFVEKNKDTLRDDLIHCCYGSSLPVVQSLFEELHNKLEEAQNGNKSQVGPRKTAGGGATTLSAKFKGQLAELMQAIEKTDPHFIRCIKPNPQNKPDHYDRKGVAEQLRYQGVLQVVQLSRAGYPVRSSCEDCWLEYKLLLKGPESSQMKSLEAHQRAEKLIARLTELHDIQKTASGGPGIAVGKTQVFFRKEAFEKLQLAKLRILNAAATKAQKLVRGVIARKMCKLKMLCVVVIQANMRGHIARNVARSMQQKKRATLCVQSHWRGHKSRLATTDLRKHLAGRRLQAAWRAHRESVVWQRLRASVLVTQGRWRARVAKAVTQRLRKEAKEVGSLAIKAERQAEELNQLRKDKESLQSKVLQLESAQGAREENQDLVKKNENLEKENKELKRKVAELEAALAAASAGQPVPVSASSAVQSTRKTVLAAPPGGASKEGKRASIFASSRSISAGRAKFVDGTKKVLAAVQLARAGERTLDVQLVGANGVGKTAMLEALFKEHDEACAKQMQTCKNLLLVHYTLESLPVSPTQQLQKVKLLDCSGEDRASKLVERWFKNATTIVLVYDPTRRDTFVKACELLPLVTKVGAQAILLANTYNLSHEDSNGSRERQVTFNDAMERAREYGAKSLEADTLMPVFKSIMGGTRQRRNSAVGGVTGMPSSAMGMARQPSNAAKLAEQMRGQGGGKATSGNVSAVGPLMATVVAKSSATEGIHCVEEYAGFQQEGTVTCLCFATDVLATETPLLAVASKHGNIVVYAAQRTNLEKEKLNISHQNSLNGATPMLKLHKKLTGHTRAVTSMFFSEGQKRLTSTSIDQTFRVWDVRSGDNLVCFTDSSAVDVAARVPTTKEIFVTANAKSILRLINAKTGTVLQKLKVENEVRAMAFDAEGRYLVLGTRAGMLHGLDCKRCDEATAQFELKFCVQKFNLSKAGITCITFVGAMGEHTPRLLVNTWDSSVAILGCMYDSSNRLTSFHVINRLKTVHSALPVQNCFSPGNEACRDGFVISGSEDNKVYIYNLCDYRLQHLKVHKAPVMAVSINTSNTLLATADSSGLVCLWRRGVDADTAAAGDDGLSGSDDDD